MTKGEMRKARKQARAEGKHVDWMSEVNEDGTLRVVAARTYVQERAHERNMERWARRMDSDPDWR